MTRRARVRGPVGNDPGPGGPGLGDRPRGELVKSFMNGPRMGPLMVSACAIYTGTPRSTPHTDRTPHPTPSDTLHPTIPGVVWGMCRVASRRSRRPRGGLTRPLSEQPRAVTVLCHCLSSKCRAPCFRKRVHSICRLSEPWGLSSPRTTTLYTDHTLY
jgi:hypothetical protein